MSKWIKFELAERQNPKTKIWDVRTKDTDDLLGQIRWFGQWRKYSFFPEIGTIFESQCLKDIAGFIEERMEERRKKKGNVV